jgi:hypothetical protein
VQHRILVGVAEGGKAFAAELVLAVFVEGGEPFAVELRPGDRRLRALRLGALLERPALEKPFVFAVRPGELPVNVRFWTEADSVSQ